MPTTSERLATLSDDELRARACGSPEANIAWAARLQAKHALRSYRNSAIVGFLILAIGQGVSTYTNNERLDGQRQAVVDSGNVVTIAGCNRDFKTALGQRQAFYRQPEQPSQPKLTEAEKDRIIKALTPLPDCRHAQDAVTDNPDQTKKPPRPLYEGLVGKQGVLK